MKKAYEDKKNCQRRDELERRFNLIKENRRDDKLDITHLSFDYLAFINIVLNDFLLVRT